MAYKNRFFQPPKNSFFLFGPRGTGKSTWLQRNYPEALTIELLSPDLFRKYSARPERLRELVEGNPDKTTIIIDEVQKIPQLLDVVHQLIEEKKGYKFILTGSSSRKLKRTGVDLLAGRAVLKTLHPFIASELGSGFNLGNALQYGLLPLVVSSSDFDNVINSYVALYLKEEVQQEGIVRNLGNFSNFLETVSFAHGSVLSVSAIARECEVERKTVESYINIMEDLLLCFKVPVFSKRAKRILTRHPKFYIFDAGVYRSLRPTGPLDAPSEIDGAALEGLVAQHIRAWIAYTDNKYKLHFWRTKSGNEVDFIVYGPDCILAIEVKNSKSVMPKDLKGLIAFRDDYPETKTFFLYRGKDKLKVKGILCLPCKDFLLKLSPDINISDIY